MQFQYPVWFILLCLLLGLAYAAALYFRDRSFGEQINRVWKWAMATFRFVTVSLLAILLLAPFIRSRHTQTVKPIVAVVQDNSESIRSALKHSDTTLYQKQLKDLVDKLSGKYEVVEYSCGDKLNKGIDFSFRDKATNLSAAFDDLNDLYYNQNIGAVVLASDGIYNQGINPVYAAAKSPYAIYTVALGDTTPQRDLKFGNAYYNKVVYLHDQLGIRVDVEATNLSGKNAVLNLYQIESGEPNKLLNTKNIAIGSNSVFETYEFVVPAEKVGIAHYRMTLSNLEGEVTYGNNAKDVYVEVLDGRQKILLVANSPHPDISALKQTVEENKNYQLDVEYAETLNKSLKDYNLVILHQLPSAKSRVAELMKQIREEKLPVLFIVGSQTSTAELQKVENALIIQANQDRLNDATAAFSKDFSLFTLSPKTLEALPKLPPLECFFGEYKTNPSAVVLLHQRINSVETNFPLIVFNETNEMKVGIVCGEGLWRWRLYDYLQNKNHDAFAELMDKTIQYLSVKGDKRPFRVTLPKNIFMDNEPISFDAQLYNANRELVNTPEVEVEVKSEDGKQYPFHFSRTEKAYVLNAGYLPVGNYSYAAKTKLGNVDYAAVGKFTVSPLQLEEMRTQADHRVLYQLATQHNGKVYSEKQIPQLADDLLAKTDLKPILYDTFSTESAINMKWIFALILLLLSAEWFSRKYLGGY